MQPNQSKSNFFITLASIAFIIVAGTSLLISVKRPVQKTIFVGNASEPGKVDLDSELVAGFPEFPVYPDATIINSYKKTEGAKVGYEANWKADDTVAQIASWYYEALIDMGWNFEEQPNNFEEYGEQFFLVSKDDLTIYLTVELEPGISETEINVEVPVQ